MFESISNLAKAAVSVALTPVALAVDIVKLPATTLDPHKRPFEETEGMLGNAGDCVKEAIKPE